MKLNELNDPRDLKGLSYADLEALAGEMRDAIIHTVAERGGHLSSNLGVVELTLALHRVFSCPEDKIIFDVGHQCYAHKLLTGRYKDFSTLRTFGGISGFPLRGESPYDTFTTGHASTAISAALGMARARKLRGTNEHIVAVVGDGALTGGMCYEALNDLSNTQTPLIVILNDNDMSISKNVGALSEYLSYMRVSKGWLDIKRFVSMAFLRTPHIGKPLYRFFQAVKNGIRNVFVHDRFFHLFGMRYIGPIDGHDIAGLERVLRRAKALDEPVVIHAVTQKGNGYALAETHPDTFHGTAAFCVDTGAPLAAPAPSLGSRACDELLGRLEKGDQRIAVVTAAMTGGTGFEAFRRQYPERIFDVGIAEEHAVTLAAGLAGGGMRPFVAIYTTFLQRAYDQILNDVCLQNLPVCFLADRYGIVGEDGATHQGIFGVAYLRAVPNLTLLAPRDAGELSGMMAYALNADSPTAILYPRGQARAEETQGFERARWHAIRKGKDAAILTFSSLCETALEAAEMLENEGISAAVYNCSTIKPLDLKTLRSLDMPYFTLEEDLVSAGFGSMVAEAAIGGRFAPPRAMLGLPDAFVPHGRRDELLAANGLAADAIAKRIREALHEDKN